MLFRCRRLTAFGLTLAILYVTFTCHCGYHTRISIRGFHLFTKLCITYEYTINMSLSSLLSENGEETENTNNSRSGTDSHHEDASMEEGEPIKLCVSLLVV